MKTYILRHRAGAVAIAILVAMPLVASLFDKTRTVLVAELISMVNTVGGAVLRQRLNQTRPRAPAGDGRRIRWSNVALVTVLTFIAVLVGLTAMESITGRPISDVHDNTGRRWPSLSETLDNSGTGIAPAVSPTVSPYLEDAPRQSSRL